MRLYRSLAYVSSGYQLVSYGPYAIGIFSDNRVLLILATWSSLQIGLLRGRKPGAKKEQRGRGLEIKNLSSFRSSSVYFRQKGDEENKEFQIGDVVWFWCPWTYHIFLVIRCTMNFLTCFFQVVKPKMLPKYPVTRCNLNFGLFHYLHFQNNSIFKVPNYSHVTFF